MATFNLKQCNSLCHQCVKQYIDKHHLRKGEQFGIPCRGIPSQYIPDSILASLGEDPKAAIAMMDPVIWANVFLDWHCFDPDGAIWKRKTAENSLSGLPPYIESEHADMVKKGKSIFHRPYQAEMLRCSSKRKIFRIGRQAGKCLPTGTLIQMANGLLKPIEMIQDNEMVVSIDENYHTKINPAIRACNGEKPVLNLVLNDGRSIGATENHPFLVRRKVGRQTTGLRHVVTEDLWVEAKDITLEDYIAVPRKIRCTTEEKIDNRYMTVLGCLLADGNLTQNNCRFSNINQTILQKLADALVFLDCSLKQYDSDKSCDYHIIGTGSGKPHRLRDWLRSISLSGLNSHQKYIPDFFMTLSNENTIELLRCLYGCDGWGSVGKDGRGQIGYATVSEKLAQQVLALLARFNIYADLRLKTVKLNGKKFYSRQICITRKESIANFKKEIGILGKEEQVRQVYLASQVKQSCPKTEKYEDGDIVFIRVKSIEATGSQMTWNLTVPGASNFIANNIITHNTETLCVMIAYNIFTHENFAVEVIAPYQNQVDLIFGRLSDMIYSNKTLANSVARNVKAPSYQIELNNESYVIGFTAGTRSGQEGASARGQTANMLVFDEADYLSSKDIDSALAVIINHPDATVWMSSTPTGRREKFYDSCQSKKYREFHYPSSINPNWNQELDDYYKEELTEDGYKHEILADFGEQEEGVYQLKYIEAAQANYTYEQMKPIPSWTYMIGVDWNDFKIGTTIAVVGFNPHDGLYYLVDKKVVSRSERTQLSACQKIADLNRIWNPAFIYVDQGYGATQIEVLRDYGGRSLQQLGPNHPDSRLRTIVKGFDFGGTQEIYDVFTKQPVKKPAKPFLVENSVRRFESLQFKYPIMDKHYTDQLLNYIIDRVSITGRPVFEAQNDMIGDHFIDAVNLALVAFTLEKSRFAKPVYSQSISFAPGFGAGNERLPLVSPRESVSENYKPKTGRAENMQGNTSILQPINGAIPASNNTNSSSVKIWDWPGFGHDAPRPSPRSTNEIYKQARERVFGRNTGHNKPKRAKF